MAHDVQRTHNTQNEINQFDNMSIDDVQSTVNLKPAEVPVKNRKEAKGTGVSAQSREHKSKSKSSNASASSAFRPVESLESKTKFRADAKPKLQEATINIPKKKFPVKVFIIILAVVALIGAVYLFVPIVNKTVTLFVTGADKYVLNCETTSFENTITGITDLSSKFTKLITDNAIKGTASLELTEDGAAVYAQPYMSGSYSGDYEFVTASKSDRFTYDLTFNDIHYGTLGVVNDYNNGLKYIQPTVFNQYLSFPLTDYLAESKNFGLRYDTSVQDFISNDYMGISVTSLFSVLSSKDSMSALFTPYKTTLQDIALDYSFDFDVSEVPSGITADTRIVGTGTWAAVKPCFDNLIQQAKSDNNMSKLVTSMGLKTQSYLDVLNDLSTKINEFYGSAGENAVITVNTYLYKDSVVYRVIKVPYAANNYYTFAITDTAGIKEIYVTKDSELIYRMTLSLSDSEAGYTGTLSVDGINKPITIDFVNLVLGDIITGDVTVTTTSDVCTLQFTTDNVQTVYIDYTSGSVKLFSAVITASTYSVATNSNLGMNNSLSMFNTQTSEKRVMDFVTSYASFDELIGYYSTVEGINIDSEKLTANIQALLLAYNNKTYEVDFPYEDMSIEVVDEAAVLRNAVDTANMNAEQLAIAANRFIQECLANEKNKYEVPNGAYQGYIDTKKENLYYNAEFTTTNLEACLACSVEAGYYCFVVRDMEVVYAFWSPVESFEERIANNNLPSHFEGIATMDEVIGSYPILSTATEE